MSNVPFISVIYLRMFDHIRATPHNIKSPASDMWDYRGELRLDTAREKTESARIVPMSQMWNFRECHRGV